MSYVKTAYRGLDLLAAQDWQGAITELSTALESSPNPAWIIARSKALVGAGRFQEALRDAEHAWHEAASRSKRELIIDAQHRRAVAHYRLGELANADCCCLYAIRMLKGGRAIEPADQDPAVTLSGEGGLWTQRPADAKEQARLEEEAVDSISRPKSERGMEDSSAKTKQWRILSVLRQQILYALSQAPEDDLRAHKCTITQKPPQGELAKLNAASASAAAGSSSSSAAAASAAKTEAAPAALPITPKSAEVKLQEYQTNDTMNVTVLSKGVDKTKLKVDFQASVVTLDPIVYPDGREGTYTLHPWADIDPAGCSYGVTPSKVEVKLKKAAPGKWASITRDASTKTAA